MRSLYLAITLAIASPFALAQNCIDGDLGTLIGTDPVDTVLPMQAIGFAFPVGGTTYTHAHITDHGYVQLSNAGVPAPVTTPQIYTPTTTNFLAGSAKVCAIYADIIGSGGGRVYINSSPTRCLITWINMQNYGIPAPRFDFQLAMYPNGDVRIVYGPGVTNNSTFTVPSDNGIVGITPGGGAALPTASDLSVPGSTTDTTIYEAWTVPSTFDMANNTLLLIASNPGYSNVTLGAPTGCAAVTNYGTGCGGLSMTGVGRPSLGNANFGLNITGITTSPVAFVAFGTVVVNPGIPLASIGMAGCNGYTNLDLGLLTSGPVAGGASTFTLGIPASPAIAGTVLSSQGVALSATTTLGLIASNGTQLNIGFGN